MNTTTPVLRAAHPQHPPLPPPDYARNYQPSYPDRAALAAAMATLRQAAGVATPATISALQHDLAALATGRLRTPLIITGRCAEPVGHENAATIAGQSLRCRELVRSAFAPLAVIDVERGRGQNVKPRSTPAGQHATNGSLAPYMGDAINGAPESERTPDPQRLVQAAQQALAVEQVLRQRIGRHRYAAHEALSLAYEYSLLRAGSNGTCYAASGDLLWLGNRTNDPDGPHAALLADITNPVGVKIGPDITPARICALARQLNPHHIPGRITWMIRIGTGRPDTLRAALGAIRQHASHTLVLYDIHGATRVSMDGTKIREVHAVIQDIAATAAAAQAAGLKLHGLHLETIMDDTRLECTDRPGQLPQHAGGIDPQLNPQQLRQVLAATARYLL